jgi:transcription termination factor Rho
MIQILGRSELPDEVQVRCPGHYRRQAPIERDTAVAAVRVAPAATKPKPTASSTVREVRRVHIVPPSAAQPQPQPDPVRRAGLVELSDQGGCWLRRQSGRTFSDDPQLTADDIRRSGLRAGDLIDATFIVDASSGHLRLSTVHTVNGGPAHTAFGRSHFDELTADHPNRQIILETKGGPLAPRLIDLFCPIGFGQRGLIVSSPKAGKTTTLKEIGQAIASNFPESQLILLLIGERPEEITDLRESLPTARLIASSFDGSKVDHIRLARLAMEHSKRLVEQHIDVVVLFDSVTRLVSAQSLQAPAFGSKTLTGGVESKALDDVRNLFGVAGSCREGGSVTIIATCLVDTGSRGDDMVYAQLKGTGNMELHISKDLAHADIFPAVDLLASGTRKTEHLVDDRTRLITSAAKRQLETLPPMARLESYARLHKNLKRSSSNADFLNRISRQ